MIVMAPWLVSLLSVVVEAHAMAFWPFIVTKVPLSAQGENHERIHLAQQVELLLLGFYILYVLDYFRARAAGASPTEAYFGIRFEREAFDHQADLTYLANRSAYAWADYEHL